MSYKSETFDSLDEAAFYRDQRAQNFHRRLKPGHSLLAPQLLRSSIFATCARKATTRAVVPAFDCISDTRRGASVEYRGAPLTQADLRVLLALLERAQGLHVEAAVISFNATEFLAAIGRSTCHRNAEALRGQLANLRSATFTVREYTKDKGQVFGFVDAVEWNGREVQVKLSAMAHRAMLTLGTTFVDTEKRCLLADGLQTSMADILASTAAESFDVKDLAALFGRADAKQVGKDVRAALDKLVAVGLLASYTAGAGRVHVVR